MDAGASQTARVRNRRGQGALLRVDIIDAAQRVLEHEGGEHGVTIRAVTRAAGIAPQSFYLHFDSVSDLLHAIYERGHQILLAQLQSAVDSAPKRSADGRLVALCGGYLAFARSHAGLYRVLMDGAGRPHPEWDADHLPGAATFALLQDVVAAVRPDLAEDQPGLFTVATMLWVQLHGLVTLTRDRPTFPWPEDAVLVAAITTAVRGAAGAASPRKQPSPTGCV